MAIPKATENGQRLGFVSLDPAVIRTECRRRLWNQQDLARQSGLSRGTISVAYRGGDITARTALKIQAAFDRVKPKFVGLIRESA